VGAESAVEAEVGERARRKLPLCPLLRRRRRLAELVGHGGEERVISPPSQMGERSTNPHEWRAGLTKNGGAVTEPCRWKDEFPPSIEG
jgi:hypothetical protein